MEREQTLPEYLKRLRRNCHYKQAFVASRLNVTRQTYSHYETGRIRPPALTMYRLADIYGVSLEDLFAHVAVCGSTDREEKEGRVPGEEGRNREFLSDFLRLDEKNREEVMTFIQERLKEQGDREKGPEEREKREAENAECKVTV